MSDQTFERAALDGKDREQLQTIASALGVKGVSRMRKADLVDAIVTSAAPAQAPKARSYAKADADAGQGNAAGSSAAREKRSIRLLARASEPRHHLEDRRRGGRDRTLSGGAARPTTTRWPIIRPRLAAVMPRPSSPSLQPTRRRR